MCASTNLGTQQRPRVKERQPHPAVLSERPEFRPISSPTKRMPCLLHCGDAEVAPPPSVRLGKPGAGSVESEHCSHQLRKIKVVLPAPVHSGIAVI